jgi:hypothetical protein
MGRLLVNEDLRPVVLVALLNQVFIHRLWIKCLKHYSEANYHSQIDGLSTGFTLAPTPQPALTHLIFYVNVLLPFQTYLCPSNYFSKVEKKGKTNQPLFVGWPGVYLLDWCFCFFQTMTTAVCWWLIL